MDNQPVIIQYERLITKLLLDNDGSTTVLLESLLNCIIHVDVIEQSISDDSDDCPARALFLSKLTHQPAVLIKRQTHLLNEQGDIIAKALVYFDQATKLQLSLDNTSQPLGKTLITHKVKQFRTILSSGNCDWHEPSQQQFLQPCAYKQYLIYGDNNCVLYVQERFNPNYVLPLTE